MSSVAMAKPKEAHRFSFDERMNYAVEWFHGEGEG